MDIWLPATVSSKLEVNVDSSTDASASWSKAHLRDIAMSIAPNRKARRKLRFTRAPLVSTNLGHKRTTK